jgi:hypothetical protein
MDDVKIARVTGVCVVSPASCSPSGSFPYGSSALPPCTTALDSLDTLRGVL